MLQLIIISKEKTIFDKEVLEVVVLTQEGPLTILENHEAYMAKIIDKVVYKTSDNIEQNFPITEGFFYANSTKCFIVVE